MSEVKGTSLKERLAALVELNPALSPMFDKITREGYRPVNIANNSRVLFVNSKTEMGLRVSVFSGAANEQDITVEHGHIIGNNVRTKTYQQFMYEEP